MARYRRKYRTWRGGSGSSTPTSYDRLFELFGGAVGEIKKAFLALDGVALDSLMSDYGSIYNVSAERYARKTYPNWQSGATKLSGQTMQRLIALIPPYLEPEQRHEILLSVLRKHKPTRLIPQRIRINVNDPEDDFKQLDEAIALIRYDDPLAFIPERVMKAAKWLYDDDMTAARAMLAEATQIEMDILRESSVREVDLLKRTIRSGQVKSASYSIKTPVSQIDVITYSKSKCFVATVCFGIDAPETQALRYWRDEYLIHHPTGRGFIVWYYTYGESIAQVVQKYKLLKRASRLIVGSIARFAKNRGERHE